MRITVDVGEMCKECPFLHGGDAAYGAEERHCGADPKGRPFPFSVRYPGEFDPLVEWCPLRGGTVTVEMGEPESKSVLTGMRSAIYFKAD